MSRSVHKEFLWSGVAVGHKGWARIPDNTYPALVSGNLCQSTQRMGHHGAQVSKPLALEADEDTVTVGPRLVTGAHGAARGPSSGCQAAFSPPVLRNNGHTWDHLHPR